MPQAWRGGYRENYRPIRVQKRKLAALALRVASWARTRRELERHSKDLEGDIDITEMNPSATLCLFPRSHGWLAVCQNVATSVSETFVLAHGL